MIKALIVEDETWIRKGIVKMIRWDQLGLQLAGEAENGREALAILEETDVDIIITDMKMPLLDGVGLFRALEERAYECEILVLSEYSDYQYMRHAIYANVFEYLLKPIDEDELNLCLRSVVAKIKTKTLQKQENGNIQELKSREIRGQINRAYLEVLSGDGDQRKTAIETLTDYGQDLTFQWYSAAVMSIWHKQDQDGGISAIDDAHMEHIVSGIGGIKIDRQVLNAFLSRQVQGRIIVLFKDSGTHQKSAYQSQKRVVEAIGKVAEDCDHIYVRIGVGSWQKRIENAYLSYNEAVAASKFQIKNKKQIVYYSQIQDYKDVVAKKTINEKQITDMLKISNKWGVLKLTESFFDEITQNEICRVSDIQKYAIDFIITFENSCRKTGHENIVIQNNYIDIVASLGDVAQIQQFTLTTIEKMLNEAEQAAQPKKGVDIVEEIREYILSSYSDEIDLIHLAQDYHINYIHLSRLFKNQVGENFSEYLTRIRMEKAKEFIQTGKFKIKDVVELVGYKNPYYFSNSYKKFFGYSPCDTK